MFRLCLAHFDSLEAPDNVSWCDEIIQLMQSFNGAQAVEVYSDIAFDVVTDKKARKNLRTKREARSNARARETRSVRFGLVELPLRM